MTLSLCFGEGLPLPEFKVQEVLPQPPEAVQDHMDGHVPEAAQEGIRSLPFSYDFEVGLLSSIRCDEYVLQDSAQEAVKKKRRATKKPYSRSIVGATLEVIQKRRTEKPEVRDAAREAALRYAVLIYYASHLINYIELIL
jgi:hypothetical protein